jgi:type I restriction-modification system DNA methylase subunit
MSLDLSRTRECLQSFDFSRLFVEELGWEPPPKPRTDAASVKECDYSISPVATLSGIGVFEITTPSGIPDAGTRALIHKKVTDLCYENLLIFVDLGRSQSLWYWVKRESGKRFVRDHLYVKGQPGDLFLGKLAAMVVDISELEETGSLSITEAAKRLKDALDVERVTKIFFKEFEDAHVNFLDLIGGIDDERERRWYASVLLHRLMFIWFLQKKFFLDNGDECYLQNKLEASPAGKNLYYSGFLRTLFFEGFAKPEESRSPEVNKLLGKIRYLNGGLFLPHLVEKKWDSITVPDAAFANLFALFGHYSWNLNDSPGGKDDEINPDVLGYIFEKYINQKEFGAYYTRPEITEYLCERTIHQLILDAVNGCGTSVPPVECHDHDARVSFATIGDLLLGLDAPLCVRLLDEILPKLSLLDPACGSGAFLVAAMKTLIDIYAAVFGRIEVLGNRDLLARMQKIRKEHASVAYYIKKRIITDNLFGVDIMEEAVEIAKLRLFLALVASATRAEELEPLPNIEFNIMSGNSLIGLLHVDPKIFDANQPKTGGAQDVMALQYVSELGFSVESKAAPTRKEKVAAFVAEQNAARFAAILEDKNKSIELYRKHAFQPGLKDGLTQEERLITLRSHIENIRNQSYARLNQMLLDEFKAQDIEYHQAAWNEKKNDIGRPVKHALKPKDIEALHPFHWGYEFDRVLNERGGFDAIITNPPWEIFKPNAKEFFEKYSDVVTKKTMTIKEFEKEQKTLLKDKDLLAAWQDYLSGFPHVSAWFRSAPQFANQISIIDGRKAGSDINLYKLFTEQCFRLLRTGGYCGIIIPSGIYTDLGTKQLREMLFGETRVDSLFGLSNEKYIFESVHHAFKFCILTFEKDHATDTFRAAFRINPREAIASERIETFLHNPDEHVSLSVPFIRRLSPDSLSVMEVRSKLDVKIAEKMFCFPLLGENVDNAWKVKLNNEFHMTNDSHLFKTSPAPGRLPLYEGKMIWQFDHAYAKAKYWIDEEKGRSALMGKRCEEHSQKLDYQGYRLAFREIASSTNERGLISTILPQNIFANHKLMVSAAFQSFDLRCMSYCVGILNSFAFDYLVRQRTTTSISMFIFYQLPMPRLLAKDPIFRSIADRSARLVCTAPEFDDLASEIFGKGNTSRHIGATEPAERARLRAELDALVAHLYGLTESEFTHILSTFPLVSDETKAATLAVFRDNSLIN